MENLEKVLVSLKDSRPVVKIGWTGENDARGIIWDISKWQEVYGDGICTLLNQRETDDAPYPCSITIDGKFAVWQVADADLGTGGNGKCQLIYQVGEEVVAKSPVYKTLAERSLGGVTIVETPDWVLQVIQAGADAVDAAERAEDAAKKAEDTADGATEAVNSAATAGIQAVNAAGQAAIGAVGNAQTSAVAAVNDAKNAGVQAVNDEKKTAVEAVQGVQAQATEAVETAGNQALQDISDAKTSATGAVNTAGENAVNSVNSAGQTAVENAQTAITTAKNQAVSDVQAAEQSAVEKVQEAQTAGVQAVENVGTTEVEKIAQTGDQRYAPIESAIKVSGYSDGLVSLSPTIPWYLQDLKIYGKSTQDGTPSPETPIPIVNAGTDGQIEVTINDGGNQSQTLILKTLNGLPGIPVDSGGNYTDENGQQWVCDTIDLDRGVYEKRLEHYMHSDLDFRKDFYNDLTETEIHRFSTLSNPLWKNRVKALCNIFVWKYNESKINVNFQTEENRIRVYLDSTIETVEQAAQYLAEKNTEFLVQLETPVEIPLSDDEIVAYNVLKSYTGTTNISASDNCGVQTSAVADGTKYLENVMNRISALEQNAIGS